MKTYPRQLGIIGIRPNCSKTCYEYKALYYCSSGNIVDLSFWSFENDTSKASWLAVEQFNSRQIISCSKTGREFKSNPSNEVYCQGTPGYSEACGVWD